MNTAPRSPRADDRSPARLDFRLNSATRFGALPMALTLAACLSIGSSFSLAAPLGLEDAIAQALNHQPALIGLARAAEAAREAAVAEAELPDPKLRFGVQNLPVTGDDRFRFGAVDMTMTTVGLMQEMVLPSKREAASARARAESSQWNAESRALARAIRRDVALTWLELYLALGQQDLIRAKQTELEAQHAVVSRQLASNQASAQQALAIQTMIAFMQDQQLQAQGRERVARAALARWLGRPVGEGLPQQLPNPAPLPLATLRERLKLHPEMLSSLAAREAAGFDAQLARVAARPDWSWEVMYGRRLGERSDLISVQVSMDLPWNQASRQDRRLAEKLALAERARYSSDDLERRLESELLDAWSQWEVADSRKRHYEDVLLPSAQAQLQTVQAGYSSGRQPLMQIWEVRRNLLDVQVQELEANVERAKAIERLNYFSGENPDVAE